MSIALAQDEGDGFTRARRSGTEPTSPCTGRDHGSESTDEELVAAAQAGDERSLETLLLRYHGIARAKARAYFLVGAERDDTVQEGMIGLCKAVREFNPEFETSFRSFAELCVARQILTAVKAATRRKHGPLNNYVSFHRPLLSDESGGCTLGEVLPTPAHTDPAEQVVFTEQVRHLQQHVDAVLSDLEAEVLRLHLEGKGYQEIARTLRRHTKSVDNALQRIKRKVDSYVMQWDAEIA